MKFFMRSEEYQTIMGRLSYRQLFREKNKRRAVRGSHLFIWELCEKVRIQMSNEMEEEGVTAAANTFEAEKKASLSQDNGRVTV